jgi:hypothetical protein
MRRRIREAVQRGRGAGVLARDNADCHSLREFLCVEARRTVVYDFDRDDISRNQPRGEERVSRNFERGFSWPG